MLGQREQFTESLAFFRKAEEIYNFVMQAIEDQEVTLPSTSFNTDFKQHLLSQMSARVGLAPEVSAFSFYINGGLDKRRLDKTYIETLKFLA